MGNQKLQTPNSKLQFLWNLGIGHWRLNEGFTLIELLVVIVIFGMTASLITASYLTFERNQRLKNAALMIKSDIRLVADKAFSGDKGVNDGNSAHYCSQTSKLGGWYIKFNKTDGNNTNYIIAGDCIPGAGNDTAFNSRSINLPKDVKISNISYIGSPLTPTNISILFRPLSQGVYINESSPPFFNLTQDRSLRSTSYTNNDLIIELQLSTSPASGTYQVVIKSTGEVSEKKI